MRRSSCGTISGGWLRRRLQRGRVWTAGARTPRSCDRGGVLLSAGGSACRWLSQDEHAVGLEVDPRAEAAVDPVEDGLQPRRVLA
jgi:hypothetical protein